MIMSQRNFELGCMAQWVTHAQVQIITQVDAPIGRAIKDMPIQAVQSSAHICKFLKPRDA